MRVTVDEGRNNRWCYGECEEKKAEVLRRLKEFQESRRERGSYTSEKRK